MNDSMASWQPGILLDFTPRNARFLHCIIWQMIIITALSPQEFFFQFSSLKCIQCTRREHLTQDNFHSNKWIEFEYLRYSENTERFGWMRQTLCKQEFHFESVKFDSRISHEFHAVVIRNHVICFFSFDKFRSASREPTTFYAGWCLEYLTIEKHKLSFLGSIQNEVKPRQQWIAFEYVEFILFFLFLLKLNETEMLFICFYNNNNGA